MSVQPCCVIVGAGQAGLQLAVSLRDLEYAGRIVLVGEEACVPYQRPPLSKAYLLGKVEPDNLQFRPSTFFQEKKIEYYEGVCVDSVEREQRQVRLSSNEVLSYDHLVLATGASNRRLPLPGIELEGVCELRSLADAQQVRDRLSGCRKAVVIGAGFIGMEFAAVAAQLGITVTVVEAASRPFSRALSNDTADYLAALHREQGVVFRCDAQVNEVLGDASGHVCGVELENEDRIDADLVMTGVGVVPNDSLARASGLQVDNGIVVDEYLATSDPAISAIGDCASYPSAFSDAARVRLESVQNAVDQARTLAQRLTGQSIAYTKVPWFWSDQFDTKLQIAGLSAGHDQTVRRQQAGKRGFSVFCLRGDRLLAVESVNSPADHLLARKLIEGSASATKEQIEDPDFDLKLLINN
ncbi:NAD(P)/FAD-dependent oxidoreductase [Chromohalobacter nigrandesensis]|uniref:NAD(P)/FAD-dependent oxidoreductase n=1 Tax=Chromohalobacter nigrandesensis TaxID=119863 RepID=UPI001FF0E951|nr:FAD-dependent oxidoreductase [Chromohalobacter nigrandesensis]MCK0745197.1 FAD-dependent oxidoreductase [Chromohalobacter nigrandesensis]